MNNAPSFRDIIYSLIGVSQEVELSLTERWQKWQVTQLMYAKFAKLLEPSLREVLYLATVLLIVRVSYQ